MFVQNLSVSQSFMSTHVPLINPELSPGTTQVLKMTTTHPGNKFYCDLRMKISPSNLPTSPTFRLCLVSLTASLYHSCPTSVFLHGLSVHTTLNPHTQRITPRLARVLSIITCSSLMGGLQPTHGSVRRWLAMESSSCRIMYSGVALA